MYREKRQTNHQTAKELKIYIRKIRNKSKRYQRYNSKNRKLIERKKERQRIGTDCEGKLICMKSFTIYLISNNEIILFLIFNIRK